MLLFKRVGMARRRSWRSWKSLSRTSTRCGLRYQAAMQILKRWSH